MGGPFLFMPFSDSFGLLNRESDKSEFEKFGCTGPITKYTWLGFLEFADTAQIPLTSSWSNSCLDQLFQRVLFGFETIQFSLSSASHRHRDFTVR